MHSNCRPPSKQIMHTSDGQPATGSPKTKVLKITKPIRINAIKQKATPIIEESAKGTFENDIMASAEYINRLPKDHFVLPATRGVFKQSIHFVSNPTYSKMPFEKRLYSPILRIASTICRVIIRKSCAPGTMFVFDILLINL